MLINKLKKFISDNFTDQKKQTQKQALLFIQNGEFEQLINLWQNNDIDINYQDGRGLTLLMSAVCYAIDHLEEGKQIIDFLLSKGADINKTDQGGRSAFLMACHWSLKEIVQVFLKYKPDLDASTKNTYLILNPTYTVLLKGNYEMAKFLLDNGASFEKVFELHNCTNQISLNSEALEFLYKYKLEKQKIAERLNFLFIRKQLIEKLQKEQQQQQNLSSDNQSNTPQSCLSYLVTRLNQNEVKELMKFI